MTWYSFEPKDRIFSKGYRFFSLANNTSRSIGKNISKNVRSKYSHKTYLSC